LECGGSPPLYCCTCNERHFLKARAYDLLQRGKPRTTPTIKTSLFGEGFDLEKPVETFVVYRLDVSSAIVHQPDAIEAVRFTVVAYPENPPSFACPRLTYIAPN
jgi:hypothetical protein